MFLESRFIIFLNLINDIILFIIIKIFENLLIF